MRRQGIGARLLAAFEARAAAAGAAEAWLETAADNAAARALYAAAGWQERGRRRGYFRRGDGTATDAVVMAKPLIHP
jgi:ribosomal-protein-alanine N-acetyltransferase